MAGRRRFLVLGLLLALAVLAPLTTMAVADNPVARMGDRLGGDGWSYRVVSFERIADPLSNEAPVLTSDDSDILGVIVIDVRNDTESAAPLELGWVVLVDASGRLATPLVDPTPTGYLATNDFASGSAVIGPGSSARIALVYSIDPSWSFPTLRLGASLDLEVRIDECHCQLPIPWLESR